MTIATRVTLDDKYALSAGRIYLSGTQALVRLPMLQRQRDLMAGLNTAGFVSGYRGSPLGGLDKEFWKAGKFLAENHVRFQSGINEDLAATAIWGTQQTALFQDGLYDGVFAMWYGKGPGVDRCGDVFKHGNAQGTAKHGGVLVLAGDDHGAKSSTLPHQSEYAFMDAQMPVLNPASLQDLLDFGLIGFALSRYSGCWVAMKAIAEMVDSSGSIDVSPDRLRLVEPTDFSLPADGVHLRWPDTALGQEYRLMRHKLYAALAFARANRIDRVVVDAPEPRFGIVTTGKAYLDVMQALEDLGIDERHAAEIGLRVYKVGMSWPLERDGVRHFAEGLDEILVVEEKRAVVENQLKEQLYNWREDVRPRVVGKFDEDGQWILPSAGELTPARIARVVAARIDRFYTSPRIKERLEWLEKKEASLATGQAPVQRIPYFCSGCPHNTSTNVPEGSRAMAGIGCHYMATWMDRSTIGFTHMGGEGVPWVGQAPFVKTRHMFQNLGDGTYFHSGSLAIRACVAADVNITFKILYNDAVAMTGGQPIDGTLTVAQITHQLEAEGVKKIVVVSDEPDKYGAKPGFADGTTIHDRHELDKLQRELREYQGVSVLIYDQTCAAEKRRRRKRGTMPDPAKRVFINELVCEGCGDCSVKSNCVSVIPVETEFGRKRAIDQSSCNKDYSCVDGFCPSFVTVHGGALRKPAAQGAKAGAWPELSEPILPASAEPYGIVITGIGGTGVVTIGALLGMAAHLEGKGISVLDMTGLAQKNGAVVSHVRIADDPAAIHAVRIVAGGANLLLGCDEITAAGFEALSKARAGHTRAIINGHQTMTAQFTHDPDMVLPTAELSRKIREAVGDDAADFVDGTALATALMGDSIASNLFMVGVAWQKGLIPLSAEAINRAIELNGAAVEQNKQAFLWGRRTAVDEAAVRAVALPHDAPDDQRFSRGLDEVIARRVDFLTDYQSAGYARRYRRLVDEVRQSEADKTGGEALTDAVARSLFKLMAYKDEYEVARLFTGAIFRQELEEQFEGDYRLEFHLAPPFLSKPDPDTGEVGKRRFGPWMMTAFRQLARLRRLRGTPLDVFGYQDERRLDRNLVADYRDTVAALIAGLTPENRDLAVRIAALPQKMRGFGHVKARNVREAKAEEDALMAAFRNPPAPRRQAAE